LNDIILLGGETYSNMNPQLDMTYKYNGVLIKSSHIILR